MFIPIDVSMYYNLHKLGKVNHVYLCPIYMYISVGDSVSDTRNIAKCHCTHFLNI